MWFLLIFLAIISSFCYTRLFKKKISSEKSIVITTSCLILSLIFSIFAFYEIHLSNENFISINLTSWIFYNSLVITWGFRFDNLTVVMCIIVIFISSLTHLYFIKYMSRNNHRLSKFMSYLSLFTFFMLLLITANNYIQMFLAWESVQLCFYFLIKFWPIKIETNKISTKTIIINKIGDFSLIIGIFLIFINFKTVDYEIVSSLIPCFKNITINFLNFNVNILSLIGIFLFIGVVGKSAQLDFFIFLFTKIETPMLIHDLLYTMTMITASVFLIIRSSFIYDEYSLNIFKIICLILIIAAFIIFSIRLIQTNFKHLIIYFICIQLISLIFFFLFQNYFFETLSIINSIFFQILFVLSASCILYVTDYKKKNKEVEKLKTFIDSIIVLSFLIFLLFPLYENYLDIINAISSLNIFFKFLIALYFIFIVDLPVLFFTQPYRYRNIIIKFVKKIFKFIFLVLCVSVFIISFIFCLIVYLFKFL